MVSKGKLSIGKKSLKKLSKFDCIHTKISLKDLKIKIVVK